MKPRRKQAMTESAPKLLPAIDEVAIVDLTGLHVGPRDFAKKSANAPSVRVRGNQATEIAELFRSLPSGMPARCHTPPFGIRFYVNDRVVCETSICWQCNNLYGSFDGSEMSYAFDATSKSTTDLLATLEKHVGHSAHEQT